MHNTDRKYGIAYCRILKKRSYLKNEKVANRKLGNLGNLRNIIPSFLVSKFSILPYSQNSDLKSEREKHCCIYRQSKNPISTRCVNVKYLETKKNL